MVIKWNIYHAGSISLVVFWTMNCLRCHYRKQIARGDDTELLLDIQLEQIQETAIVDFDSSTTVSHDHSSTTKSVVSDYKSDHS